MNQGRIDATRNPGPGCLAPCTASEHAAAPVPTASHLPAPAPLSSCSPLAGGCQLAALRHRASAARSRVSPPSPRMWRTPRRSPSARCAAGSLQWGGRRCAELWGLPANSTQALLSVRSCPGLHVQATGCDQRSSPTRVPLCVARRGRPCARQLILADACCSALLKLSEGCKRHVHAHPG